MTCDGKHRERGRCASSDIIVRLCIALEEISKELAWAAASCDPGCNKYELGGSFFVLTSGWIAVVSCFTNSPMLSIYLGMAPRGTGCYNALGVLGESYGASGDNQAIGPPAILGRQVFSMNDTFYTIRCKMTVREYLECGLDAVDDKLHRVECEPSIASLFCAAVTLYGHLGCISVCGAAATDYSLYSSIMGK